MSEMVERVARAISFGLCEWTPETCEAEECLCRWTARTAIKAMREPTHHMQHAGYGPDPKRWHEMFPIGVWDAMIRRALR